MFRFWIGMTGVVLLGLLLWGAGVFRVNTKDGTIVLENLPADADVLVDGKKATVTWGKEAKKAEISVVPGTHTIEATRGAVKIIGAEIEIEEGGRKVLTARLTRLAKPGPPESKQPLAPISQTAEAPPQALSEHLEIDLGGVQLKTVRIEPGNFVMGSPKNEAYRIDNESQHEVEITQPFYMGVYLVTQAQYQRIMGRNPSDFSAQGELKERVAGINTEEFPVENVTWYDAQEFCKRVTELPEMRAQKLACALPTEAEWEYACRAGTRPAYWLGETISKDQANYGHSSESGRTMKVGSFPANVWGLYDMHGNVWEWCADWYQKDYYEESPARDPGGPAGNKKYRILRGGSYSDDARYCRSACRSSILPDRCLDNIGFRVVLRLP